MPHESTGTPVSHSATDPVKFNVVSCYKPILGNQTYSNTPLLRYLTCPVGLTHEWSSV